MHPTPVLLPGKSHGRRSLVGCSPWGHEESDTYWTTSLSLSLSCIGEGNGTPLQCSYLENPRDGGAWWAAICGVSQSQTRLKRLSSSRTSVSLFLPCKQVHLYHFSRFHIFTWIYNICFFLVDLQLLWPSLQIIEVDTAISLLQETSSGRLGDAQVSELARVEATSSWIPFLCSYSL